MLAFPIVVGLIILTAFLTAVVSTSMPYVINVWNAFKSRIRRKKDTMDVVDVIIIAQLQERIDELEDQVDNLAQALSTRDKNRKSNLRRDVREYLNEIKNG